MPKLPQTSGAASGQSEQTGEDFHAVDRFAPPGRSRRRRPPKLYRIGELVDYSGVSRQTIHNYTTMGLLQESRWTEGGHRLYDESAFDHLDLIAEMKVQNHSMESIREYFAGLDREQGSAPERPGEP